MTAEQKIRVAAARAVARHRMIENGDRILIGLSGGKDSFALLDVLLSLQKKAPISFELLPVVVDAGFGMDYTKVERHLRKLGLNHLIVRENISSIIRKNTDAGDTGKCCSLCSRIRRGVLCRVAAEHGCNKIALGHNLDDAIETLLMNMFFVSSIEVMRPVYLAEDRKIRIIRPLIHVPERLTEEYAKEKRFPIVRQKCLFRKEDSRRAQVKAMVRKMAMDNPYFYTSMINSIEKISCKKD